MPKRDPRLAKSRLEALLSMGTSVAAEPLAGLAGLYGAATGGLDESVRMIDKVRGKLTYQPRDPRGLQEIGNAVAPVMNAYEAGKRRMGDATLSRTGSPAAATAAYTAPEGIAAMLGLRPALAAGRGAQAGLGRLAQHVAQQPSPMMGSPVSQIGAIRAYHGSPHDFDKFSMDNIGTGEGAQAYGHGLYFAGKKEVAEQYQKDLSGDGFMAGDGQMFYPSSLRHLNIRTKAARGDFQGAIEAARAIESSDSPVAYLAQSDRLTLEEILAKGELKPNNGALYDVELAPDETDLLDWDAPLSEQPEKVRQALGFSSRSADDIHAEAERLFAEGNAGGKYWGDNPELVARYNALNDELDRLPPNITGANYYMGADPDNYLHALMQGANSSAGMSQELFKKGIPGIRYLDGGSRDKGDGSRNYVMFDDSLVKILGKR